MVRNVTNRGLWVGEGIQHEVLVNGMEIADIKTEPDLT